MIASHGLGARRPTTTFAARATTAAAPLAPVAAPNVALPTSVDLRRWAVTPGNQGALNSCVPWVIDHAMLGWYSRFSGRVGRPFAPMNHPVAIGTEVRSGFDFLGAGATAVDDDVTSAIRGYHEVLAVGYDSVGIIVQNSWGTGWANGGFGRISWRVVQEDVGDGATIDGFVQAATAPPVRSAGNTGAITRYDAWYQYDGRPFVVVSLASAMSTSFSRSLIVGHKNRVAARARVGTRVGAIRYGATFVA